MTADLDVQACIARARAAQPAWAALGFEGRGRHLLRALDVLLGAQEEFLDVFDQEVGRPRTESIMMEIFPACDALSYYARRAEKLLADETPSLHLLKNKKVVIRYLPLGVVGVITPWNAPFALAVNPTAQALMAGNTVILKPSEITPRSSALVGEMFKRAGLPEGVLQVIQGDGAVGAALVSGGVDKISFTGSVATGKKIGEVCGRNLTPCTLELGGKDATIVCADADLDRAAGGIVFGAFMNSGQACLGIERVYVVESVADRFTEKVLKVASGLRNGPNADLGRIIWPRQMEIIERHMADALAKGARVLLGGGRSASAGAEHFEPTVITNVTHDMLVMSEETFGPILPIMRVASEDEAIKFANDCDYGLSGTVWTKDAKKAESIARRMHTGSVCVNDSSLTYGIHEAPFGGRKQSGLGAVNGLDGLKSYTFAQPVVHDRFGLAREQVWYPYTKETGAQLQKIIRMAFGTRIGRWLT